MEPLTAEKWNGSAGDYQRTFQLGQNDYNRAVLAFWQEQGMLHPGCRVLDIGCGVGKYGVMLAELGCDVTLTDISPEMLRHAEENMAPYASPWRCFACDFHAVTGQEPVFASGFDFSFSTMSPAVQDVETVRKMSRMTRGWCFLSRFSAWRQPLRDQLLRCAGMEPSPMFLHPEEDCAALLRAVSDAGFQPQLRYADYSWSDRRGVADMTDYMLRHYWKGLQSRDAAAEALEAAARRLCGSQGFLDDRVDTQVAWIYWDTRQAGKESLCQDCGI